MLFRVEVAANGVEVVLGIGPRIILDYRGFEASEKLLLSLFQVEFHSGQNSPAFVRIVHREQGASASVIEDGIACYRQLCGQPPTQPDQIKNGISRPRNVNLPRVSFTPTP